MNEGEGFQIDFLGLMSFVSLEWETKICEGMI